MTIVFLSYISRSGGTFFSSYLNGHPQICVCPDSDAIKMLATEKPGEGLTSKTIKAVQSAFLVDFKGSNWLSLESEVELLFQFSKTRFELLGNFLNVYKKQFKPSANTLVVLLPNRMPSLQLLQELSTGSTHEYRFIFLLRDPRAIYGSHISLKEHLQFDYKLPNLIAFSKYWKKFTAYVQKDLKDNKAVVRYEDLIHQFPNSIGAIIAWLKLKPYQPLYHLKNLGFVNDYNMPLHPNIDKGPSEKLISRWKDCLSLEETKIIETVVGSALEKMRYTPCKNQVGRIWLWHFFIWKLKALLIR